MTACRERRTCATSPTPPEASKLVAEALSGLKEHQLQTYSCSPGFTLKGIQHPLINQQNFKVELPCVTEDSLTDESVTEVTFLSPTDWSPPVEWPSCLEIKTECTELPENLAEAFQNVTSLPVAVGEELTFKCLEEGTHKGPLFFIKTLLFKVCIM